MQHLIEIIRPRSENWEKQIAIWITFVALLLISGFGAPVFGEAGISYRGAAELLTLDNGDVQLALDRFDENGISDGTADHLFILQKPEIADRIDLSLPEATISYAPGKLTLRAPPNRKIFWRLSSSVERTSLKRLPSNTQVIFGAGISHHSGDFEKTPWELVTTAFITDDETLKITPDGGGGVFCDSGGIGANSCSNTCGSTGHSCTADCDPGYYACCNCSATGVATCSCKRNPKGSKPPGNG